VIKDWKILYKELSKQYDNKVLDNDELRKTNTELSEMHTNALKRIFELKDQIVKLKGGKNGKY
tara:strand:- start:3947 stop:4135 length:189 start_codon:yes stop_codon:yes gene_type:complete